jgi:hypothetical protein
LNIDTLVKSLFPSPGGREFLTIHGVAFLPDPTTNNQGFIRRV